MLKRERSKIHWKDPNRIKPEERSETKQYRSPAQLAKKGYATVSEGKRILLLLTQ